MRGVSFALAREGSLGIVGESGSGKTTIAQMLVGLEAPTRRPIAARRRAAARRPGGAAPARAGASRSSSRTRTRRSIRARPPTGRSTRSSACTSTVPHRSAPRRCAELLEAVGLSAREARALPSRALGRPAPAASRSRARSPRSRALLILDEAVSALDVSVQAQILNLLADLRRELGLAYLLISHDLAVIRQLSDEVLVMYRGEAVERGQVDDVLARPSDPYTRALLASVPHAGMALRRREDPAAGPSAA